MKRQWKVSVDKCKIMLTGRNNYNLIYKIMGSRPAITTQGTLEVITDISMTTFA